MTEWLLIAGMGLGGILFSVGGTGHKWMRRYLLPACLAIITIQSGMIWWKCLVMAILLAAALSLPYGERTTYLGKFLVFCSYSLATLILGFNWWQVVTPVILIALFALSNWKPTAKTVVWKVWEFCAGVLCSLCVLIH